MQEKRVSLFLQERRRIVPVVSMLICNVYPDIFKGCCFGAIGLVSGPGTDCLLVWLMYTACWWFISICMYIYICLTIVLLYLSFKKKRNTAI
ncbi:hypothetical protein F4703DRAFT_1878745, partial [Phycomyces blakesleeanus]